MKSYKRNCPACLVDLIKFNFYLRQATTYMDLKFEKRHIRHGFIFALCLLLGGKDVVGQGSGQLDPVSLLIATKLKP